MALRRLVPQAWGRALAGARGVGSAVPATVVPQRACSRLLAEPHGPRPMMRGPRLPVAAVTVPLVRGFSAAAAAAVAPPRFLFPAVGGGIVAGLVGGLMFLGWLLHSSVLRVAFPLLHFLSCLGARHRVPASRRSACCACIRFRERPWCAQRYYAPLCNSIQCDCVLSFIPLYSFLCDACCLSARPPASGGPRLPEEQEESKVPLEQYEGGEDVTGLSREI